MIIHKIFLKAGQIESCHELQSDEMDHALLRQAKQTVSALLAGRTYLSVSVPLAEGVRVRVSLGITHGDYSVKSLREWLSDPQFRKELEAGEGEGSDRKNHVLSSPQFLKELKEMEERNRRLAFELIAKGYGMRYRLVPMDTADNDSGICGSVAGSAVKEYISQGKTFEDLLQRTAEENEKEREEMQRVAQEIISLKPAFIGGEMSDDPRSVFGDHFAVAMLIADATWKQTKKSKR